MNPSDRNDCSRGSRVLDVEILEPESGRQNGGGRRESRGFQGFAQSGPTRVLRVVRLNGGGCLAPAITFALFIICLGQYGLLAAISFFVFHVIGGIFSVSRAARDLSLGLPHNVWAWRCGNWAISFLLTAWLAGGLS